MHETYIVQEGDTLTSIAKKFNVPLFELARINGLENTYFLPVGSRLQIPINKRAAFYFYTIKEGDTLSSIARETNTSVEDIILLNGLNPSEYIYPYQQLLLPKKGIGIYLSRPGESLQEIAKRLAINPEDLLIYNDHIVLLPEQLLAYRKWKKHLKLKK